MDMTKYEIIMYVEHVSTPGRFPIILAATKSLDEANEMFDKIRDILPTAEVMIV